MQLSPSIFKAYDVRGIVPATLTEEVAEALGRAFGTFARREGETAVAVGRDGRLSGPSLSAALVRGLVASGVDVIDVGMVTTPMLYFAANTLCNSGIQVTGSHNPRDYNGFKMVLAGRAIYGDEIQALRKMMETAGWDQPAAPGKVRNINVLAPYRDRIRNDIRLARPLRIVVDCGNGVAGASAPVSFSFAIRSRRFSGLLGSGWWLGKLPSTSLYISMTSQPIARKMPGAEAPATPLPQSTTIFNGRASLISLRMRSR